MTVIKLFLQIFWAVWNWWFRLPDKLRFLLVGGFNATVAYCLYALLLWIWGDSHYMAALNWSWILSSISSFICQKIFVFCTKGRPLDWLKEYLKCLATWLVSYVINAVVLWALVSRAGMNPYLAQIIAVACTTVSSYCFMKYFVFKTADKTPQHT